VISEVHDVVSPLFFLPPSLKFSIGRFSLSFTGEKLVSRRSQCSCLKDRFFFSPRADSDVLNPRHAQRLAPAADLKSASSFFRLPLLGLPPTFVLCQRLPLRCKLGFCFTPDPPSIFFVPLICNMPSGVRGSIEEGFFLGGRSR